MNNILITSLTAFNVFVSPIVPGIMPADTNVTAMPKESPKAVVKVTSAPKPVGTFQKPMMLAYSGPLTDTQIQFLGNCESGMTATRNSGNGYYGAFQFSIGAWNRMNTGYARADLAPIEVQIDAVKRLVTQSNIFGQFPGCSRRMRAQGLI